MPEAPARITELDALRGIAALAVLVFHFTTKYDELFGRTSPLGFGFPLGQHGVDFFFMLSGYVIFMTLERSRSAWDFVKRRAWRLYPVFWAAVAVTYVTVRLVGWTPDGPTAFEALANLTMAPGLLDVRPVDGVYWSLQTELFFYAAILVLHRTGCLRRLPLTLGIWIALAALAQAAIVEVSDHALLASGVRKLQTLLSLDYAHDFGLGMLIYAGQRRGFSWKDGAAAAVCLLFRGVFDSWGAALLLAGLATILLATVQRRFPWLKASWLVYLGSISYPLYLVHQNLGYIVIRASEQVGLSPVGGVLLAAATALLAASVLHWCVERPALRRRISGDSAQPSLDLLPAATAAGWRRI